MTEEKLREIVREEVEAVCGDLSKLVKYTFEQLMMKSDNVVQFLDNEIGAIYSKLESEEN